MPNHFLHKENRLQGKPAIPCHHPWCPITSAQKGTIKASFSLSLSNSSNNSALISQEIKNKVKPKPAPNSCPLTPIDFLERASVVYGDCPSIMYNDTIQTWSETHRRCLKLASSIVSLGIKKGDVLSVLAPNVPAMCELHLAVLMAGAILNTINLHLDTTAVCNILQHSESKLVFVDSQFASLVQEAISIFPSNLKPPTLVLIKDEYYENCVNDCYGYIDYVTMVENGDRPISLNYTSGTTSSPKGVLQSHRGAFLICLNSLLDWSVPSMPVFLWTLPMFHANGWSLAAIGGINRYNITHMCGTPVVLNMLANHPCKRRLESPIYVMTAGAPPPAAVLGRAASLRFIVSHVYGLIEIGGPMVTCAWKQEWDHLSLIERAKLKARQGVKIVGFAGVDVVDADSGVPVTRDGFTMGDIVLRGGSVMLAYLKDPEGTSKCMRNGWFYTGDVGMMHPDGYLEVKDRSKDVIICGGENLRSVEVEAVLYSHSAVNEAAVVAQPNRYWGETTCAFVSLKEDLAEKPSEKGIREFCKAKLPLYMVPRMVVFIEELPKTSTGKIRKVLLREMAKELRKL
ncbi:Acyl-CoA synthetase [Handroanthus impetiginosus]|uniref:Acyl-CoA synthetase n=1 Tax=Handroanthus impetiginosus TaxID=429701 RepID=A0A2G9H4X0_9LAMI|nr:Acyl-CoA synthetase [Handroanthus impetiginosus]